jgi:hypothetical protein
MRKLKINNILDSDKKKEPSLQFPLGNEKFSSTFHRMLNTYRKFKHNSKGSLSYGGTGNNSATGRAQSGRIKVRKPLTQKSKKKLPIFDRKEKIDLSKIHKSTTKKSSIASSTKTKKKNLT